MVHFNVILPQIRIIWVGNLILRTVPIALTDVGKPSVSSTSQQQQRWKRAWRKDAYSSVFAHLAFPFLMPSSFTLSLLLIPLLVSEPVLRLLSLTENHWLTLQEPSRLSLPGWEYWGTSWVASLPGVKVTVGKFYHWVIQSQRLSNYYISLCYRFCPSRES